MSGVIEMAIFGKYFPQVYGDQRVSPEYSFSNGW